MAEGPTQAFNSPIGGELYWLTAGQVEHANEVKNTYGREGGAYNRGGAVGPNGSFEGEIGQTEDIQKAKAAYNEAQNAIAFRNQLQKNEERANKGGILTSGINASRIGNLESGLARTQFKQQSGLQEQLRGDIKARLNAKEKYESGIRGIVREGISDAQKKAEETQTPPITAASGGPPGSRVEAGPGSPGQPLKFGFKEAEGREARARQKPLQFGFKEVEAKEARERAARKAKRR